MYKQFTESFCPRDIRHLLFFTFGDFMETKYQDVDAGIEQKSGIGYQTKLNSSSSGSTEQKSQGSSKRKRQRRVLRKEDEDMVIALLEKVQEDADRTGIHSDIWIRVTPKGVTLLRTIYVEPDGYVAENRRPWERE